MLGRSAVLKFSRIQKGPRETKTSCSIKENVARKPHAPQVNYDTSRYVLFYPKKFFFLYSVLKILWHHSVSYSGTFLFYPESKTLKGENFGICSKVYLKFPCCSKANLLLINLLFRIRKPLPLAVTRKTLL